MSTKIKGHRIDDGAVSLNHLAPTIKIPESQLNLTYKTHSNEGDLTVAQKNTLTLAGNADALHYHTGGGGGPQGIYTNQERDAQLLKLAMLVNSNIFGLDKAVIDDFDDDSSMYKGFPTAQPPVLQNLTNNAAFPGTLMANKEYSYGVSFKNHYGQTNVMKVASIRTEDGTTNSIRVQVNDIPAGNTGLSIYRTEGTTELLLVDETDDSWENPHGVKQEVYASDKTAGLSSTAFTYEGSKEEFVEYVSKDMQAVPDISMPLVEPANKDVPFDYYLIAQSRTSAYALEILWDNIPSYAPRDYEVYYTKDTQVLDFENANWVKFDKLKPYYTTFKVRSQSATDGEIEDNYKVTNNTTPINKFYINPVEGITYLRIRVTKIDNLCRLRQVNMLACDLSSNRHFFLDTERFDFTGFNTIKFDYKTTGKLIPFQVEAQRKDEAVNSVVKQMSFSHANMSTDIPEVKDGMYIFKSYYSNTVYTRDYNRVRIGLRVKGGSDFRGENFYLRLTSVNDYNVAGKGNLPFFNIPITFGGKSYLESFQSTDNDVWSDWIYLPRKDVTLYNPELVFKSVRGTLKAYATTGAYAHWPGVDTIGKEDKPNYVHTTSMNTGRACFIVEYGISNSVSKNLTNGFTHGQWHKGYLDIASVNALKYLKFFTGAATTETGTLILDNFTVTKNKNILGPSVSYTTAITPGGSVTDVTADDFGLSKNKQVYFNQYATVVNPQVVMFDFGSVEHTINQINFTCTDRSKAPTNYILQFSTEDSAEYGDPLASPKWINFTGMHIGESSFDIGFTGTIKESRIINNNICNTVLAHRFDPAVVKKVRVCIEGTIGGNLPLINNIEIYSAIDNQEMKLIVDEDGEIKVAEYVVYDTGLTTKNETAPSTNTTGSCNVIWNKDKNCIETIGNNEGIFYTNTIPVNLFQDFMMCVQKIGDVDLELSFDDGETFISVPLDTVCSIPAQSDSVVIKAIIPANASLHAIAMLYSL